MQWNPAATNVKDWVIVVFASFLLLGENNILPFYNPSPLTIVKQFTNASYIPTSQGSYDISLYRWENKLSVLKRFA